MKTNGITQEFIRRLSNTSIDQPQTIIDGILEEYVDTLFMSGYNKVQISKCLIAAINGYERRIEKELEGGEGLHRDGAAIKRGTRFKKPTAKSNWYRQEGNSSNVVSLRKKYWGGKRINKQPAGCTNKPSCAPVFIPRKPNGTLAVKIREIEAQYNKHSRRKVKIVEEGGSTLANLLFKPDPWESRDCERSQCQTCKVEEG